MSSQREILVATDFSDCARAAERFARELAIRLGAKVAMVHVYQLPPPTFENEAEMPELTARILRASESALEEEKSDLFAGAALEVQTVLVDGDPATAIPQLAAERQSDLIVIGRHGGRSLRHFLLGSVAERILKTARCTVLTVPMG